MKLRTPALVLILAAVGAAGYGGWTLYGEMQLRNTKLDPVAPGKVNLIAVNPGAGYRVIVSNQVAHLAELSDSSGSRNDIDENDFPPNRVVWDQADVEKALAGDPVLKARLEKNLHTRLDGTPLDSFNLPSLLDGIVLRIPLKMEVTVNGEPKIVETTILEPFMTRFAAQAGRRITAKFQPSEAAILALYREEAANAMGQGKDANGAAIPATVEDVANSLRSRFSDARREELLQKPKRVLDNAFVVITDRFVTGGNSSQQMGANRIPVTDIRLNLSDQGRLRLWKYSRQKPGFQLLFVVNGVAIAAPRIRTELAQREVTIRGVGDPDLAADAVDTINQLSHS
jgi:hypothetical protein